MSMIVSFLLTLLLEIRFVDEITITYGVLTGIVLLLMSSFLLLETILDICNP
ncbi:MULTISPECIES: hypothetical protein [unclassified Acinetobacter]|uniref:hypothetical protein n=1 Tax=unclassified Acinetobacter TaxID=196816 RepID=UPI002934537C|nr:MULTISPECIES: hypothetical protein [unclassified Acinetobacter]WOE31133.1 hypothetical protein QSG84_12405 [Acinetobacter sp. SAAs470]WOE39329.1 hypothetical protein QSG86_06070 [Acinetobacter sp. SAAs474]